MFLINFSEFFKKEIKIQISTTIQDEQKYHPKNDV